MKTKIKKSLTLIAIIATILAIMFTYEIHKDQRRADYAMEHNCSWTIQGSHDVCK